MWSTHSSHSGSKRIIAISCSDLHLSHRNPSARPLENWMRCQKKQLQELSSLVDKYQVPLLVAGDVFDKPSMSAEIVNLALCYFPKCYGLVGQHDLFSHQLENIKKSSFWTLVEGGVMTYVEPGKPLEVKTYTPLILHGFPYGVEVYPNSKPCDLVVDIALIHSYIWMQDKGHVNADTNARVGSWGDLLKGYDFALIGDNHKPFDARIGDTTIVNHGSFFRRHRDEVDHKPSVALLHADLSVERYYLDVSQDVFVEEISFPSSTLNAGDFLKDLRELGDTDLDFREVVFRSMEDMNIRQGVRTCILDAMGENQ